MKFPFKQTDNKEQNIMLIVNFIADIFKVPSLVDRGEGPVVVSLKTSPQPRRVRLFLRTNLGLGPGACRAMNLRPSVETNQPTEIPVSVCFRNPYVTVTF
jgi:hypothetical protein